MILKNYEFVAFLPLHCDMFVISLFLNKIKYKIKYKIK